MGKTTKALWRISLAILLPILFIVTMSVFALPIFSRIEPTYKREVKGNIPRNFPILVITPADANNNCQAHILYKEDLNDFLANSRQYTFLVPEGQAEKLNEVILKNCGIKTGDMNSDSQYPKRERFKVTPLANGRQLLEVEHSSGDIKNVGWYETDGKEILPKFHKNYFGPGVAMLALPWAFLANIIVWGVGLYFYIRRRKRCLTAVPVN